MKTFASFSERQIEHFITSYEDILSNIAKYSMNLD